MIAWASLLVGAAIAQGLVAPDPGQPAATSVRVERGQLTIQAGAHATNRITVVQQQTSLLSVTDVVPIVPGMGCQQVTTTRVSCPASGINSVFFSLGDGDDSIDLGVQVPTDGSGDSGADGIWGSPAEDTLDGGIGNDSIYGNGGADTLFGGPGEDILRGGSGDDTLYGDSDAIEPSCGDSGCEDDLYGGTGDDELAGGESADELFGDAGADHLYEPSSGSNRLDGGIGNDTIEGKAGMRDMAVYSDRTGDVGVNLSGVNYTGEVEIPAETGGEFGLMEQDVITGVMDIQTGSGNDILIADGGYKPTTIGGDGEDQCDPDGNTDDDGDADPKEPPIELRPCPGDGE